MKIMAQSSLVSPEIFDSLFVVNFKKTPFQKIISVFLLIRYPYSESHTSWF